MRERTVHDIELDKVLDDVRAHSLSPEGRADTKRAASVFLHELRRGKYGGLTLERPDETDTQNMSE